MAIHRMSRPRQVAIGIMVFDRPTDRFGQTRRFFLDVGPDIFFVVDKRHRFRLAVGKVHQEDHNGVDQNGFDDDGIA